MPAGIRFYSLLDNSGYGQAAIGYVRALVNAGAAVEWIPIRNVADGARVVARDAIPLLGEAADSPGLVDLPALLAATAAPIDPAVVATWCVPELWPALQLPGRRNVGMTVWETDRIPAHWRGLLHAVDALVVPSAFTRDVFVGSGVRVPVTVVPHVRRHAWSSFTGPELAAAREGFGIPSNAFVFYNIGTWDPRKDPAFLLQAFAQAFGDSDDVVLVLKVPPQGYGDPPYYSQRPTTVLAEEVLTRLQDLLGRPLPRIVLLPYELNLRGIDLLHALGDCYVSFSHGEGFALGAFDAATRGIPVVMTDWGGQGEYLGTGHSGLVASRRVPVPVFPPSQPSYWPSQRWAQVSLDDAIAALHRAVAEAPAARTAALAIELDIANRYADPVIGPQLRRVLGA
jgi:glycosyltransferase involved in cell wall biosynthesis